MLHVLTTFNLKPGVSIAEFREMLGDFEDRLLQLDLVCEFGKIGRRFRDTIMDTDDDRDHTYFFLMSFRDREQCDRAIALMRDEQVSMTRVHRSVYAMVDEPLFSCWEDIAPAPSGS